MYWIGRLEARHLPRLSWEAPMTEEEEQSQVIRDRIYAAKSAAAVDRLGRDETIHSRELDRTMTRRSGSGGGPEVGGNAVGRQRLRERPEMATKPVGQLRPIDPAGGEIEHEPLLLIDGGVDLRAVEDE
jgi:hypothetical protein